MPTPLGRCPQRLAQLLLSARTSPRIRFVLRKFKRRPPIGWVRFGSLRRLTPISSHFGFDRGRPIDRYYIENFLDCQAKDIKGRVLEIKDNTYSRKYGN